jgi:hypothetical protein
MSKWLLSFIFSINAFAFAQNLLNHPYTQQELENIRLTCEQKSKMNCDRKYIDLFALQKDLCKIDFEKNNCADKIKKNSDESWRYKKCDDSSLCIQNQYDSSESLAACGLGLLELPRVIGQAAVDVARATPSVVKNYLGRVSSRINDREQMLKNCNLSIECKRKLARGNPSTLSLADPKNEKDLAKYSAVYLWSKNIEYEPIRVQHVIRGTMRFFIKSACR